MKKKVTQVIGDFGAHLCLDQFDKAAAMYINYAYSYHKEFNTLLDVYDVKEKVFEIVRNREEHGEYINQK